MISSNYKNRFGTKWIEQMEVYNHMLNYLMRITVVIFVIGILQTTYGQKATEIFIPVGQSPGLSGTYTTMGTVSTINAPGKTIIMSNSVGTYTIKLSDKTMIWLDQSSLKLKNKSGSFDDIKNGMLVEVKYKNNKPENAVEWIKVQITK